MEKTESKIQQECNVWFWNTYPKYRGLLNYNLNNSKNAIDGAKNKSLGLIAGRSDMVLYFKSKAYMIEFKTPTGNQSMKQKEWQALIEMQGFEYHIIRSLSEFQKLIYLIFQANV